MYYVTRQKMLQLELQKLLFLLLVFRKKIVGLVR